MAIKGNKEEHESLFLPDKESCLQSIKSFNRSEQFRCIHFVGLYISEYEICCRKGIHKNRKLWNIYKVFLKGRRLFVPQGCQWARSTGLVVLRHVVRIYFYFYFTATNICFFKRLSPTYVGMSNCCIKPRLRFKENIPLWALVFPPLQCRLCGFVPFQ